jgi:cytochrome P450
LFAVQATNPALNDQAIARLAAGLLFAGCETTVAAIDKGGGVARADADLHDA